MRVLLSLILSIGFILNVQAQNIANKATETTPLAVGETVPAQTKLVDSAGKTIVLSSIISAKPTVLVFYRGGWCPYCNRHLANLAKIEQDIIDEGYQIIAVSPDDYSNLKPSSEKRNVKYQLYSDPSSTLGKAIGIGFKTPKMIKAYAATKRSHKGKVSDVIPVPAVFVLDTEGKIQYEYVNPNYKQRLSGDSLLAELQKLARK